MKTYWHIHERGFANECTLLRADSPDEAAWLAERGFERINRDRLARHLAYSAPQDGRHWPAKMVTDPNEAHIRCGWDVFAAGIYIKEVEDGELSYEQLVAADLAAGEFGSE